MRGVDEWSCFIRVSSFKLKACSMDSGSEGSVLFLLSGLDGRKMFVFSQKGFVLDGTDNRICLWISHHGGSKQLKTWVCYIFS